MKRYLATRLILYPNEEGFENLMSLISTLYSETELLRGSFIVYIDKDEIIPRELFMYKECFNWVNGNVRLWSDGKLVTRSNYMNIAWDKMTDIAPITEDETILK